MESKRFEDYVFNIEFMNKGGTHVFHNFGKLTMRGVHFHTSDFSVNVMAFVHPARRYRINRKQNQTCVLFAITIDKFIDFL